MTTKEFVQDRKWSNLRSHHSKHDLLLRNPEIRLRDVLRNSRIVSGTGLYGRLYGGGRGVYQDSLRKDWISCFPHPITKNTLIPHAIGSGPLETYMPQSCDSVASSNIKQ